MPNLHEMIRKPATTCSNCGAPLEALPKHESRLVAAEFAPEADEPVEPTEPEAKAGGEGQEEGEQAVRQDFCPACQTQARAGAYHGRWLAQRPAPAAPTRSQTRKARAARLRTEYLRLIDNPSPSDEDLDTLYVAAHLLLKTGGFKWLRTDQEAGLILFEDVAMKEPIEIKIVPHDQERLNRAQERLSALL